MKNLRNANNSDALLEFNIYYAIQKLHKEKPEINIKSRNSFFGFQVLGFINVIGIQINFFMVKIFCKQRLCTQI